MTCNVAGGASFEHGLSQNRVDLDTCYVALIPLGPRKQCLGSVSDGNIATQTRGTYGHIIYAEGSPKLELDLIRKILVRPKPINRQP